MTDVKLKLKSIEEGKAAPLLASFVQGPPVESSLTGEGGAGTPFPPLAFCYSVPRSDTKRSQAVLAADNGVVRYEGGAAAHSQSAIADASKYFVGVYSRKRKRIEVFPAEAEGGVFNLNVAGVNGPNAALGGGDGAGDLEGLSARGRRDLLIDAFGSRKKQKMEKSKKANIVDVKAVAAADDVAATLQETSASLAAMKDDEEDEEEAGAGGSGMGGANAKVEAALMEARKATLPPFNEAAARPSDGYPLHSLIDDEAADALAGKVHAVFHAALEAASVDDLVARFRSPHGVVTDALRRVAAPIVGLTADGDDGNWSDAQSKMLKAAKRRLRVLQYMSALLELALAPEKLVYTMPPPPKPAAEGGETAAAPEAAAAAEEPAAPAEPTIRSLRFVPKALVPHLLSRFTEARPDRTGTSLDGKTYARTPALKDKLIAHLAAAALHLDDFTVDTRGLQTALKMTPLRVCHYFRELGCLCVPVRAASMDAPHEEAKAVSKKEGKAGAAKGTVIVSYSCELKVPLTFPRPKLGRAK